MEQFNQIIGVISDYINLISIIVGGGLALIALFYKIRNNIIQYATQFIALIEEDNNLTGPEKMDMVISWIKDLIPRIFTVVLNDTVIRAIAQSIYDDMKKYKDNYIQAKTGVTTKEALTIVRTVSIEVQKSLSGKDTTKE